MAFFNQFNDLCMVILYIPSVDMIEVFGINRALTLSSLLTSVGLWLAYGNFQTFGGILVNIGMPFAVNCITKIGGAWFGPRARNVSTMLIFLSIYGAITIIEIYDMQFG